MVLVPQNPLAATHASHPTALETKRQAHQQDTESSCCKTHINLKKKKSQNHPINKIPGCFLLQALMLIASPHTQKKKTPWIVPVDSMTLTDTGKDRETQPTVTRDPSTRRLLKAQVDNSLLPACTSQNLLASSLPPATAG